MKPLFVCLLATASGLALVGTQSSLASDRFVIDAPVTLSGHAQGFVRVGEKFSRPPIAPDSAPPATTKSNVADAITTDLKAKFKAAADPATHLLTKEGANKTGWGWAVDHFDEIDTERKGAVRYEDVIRYLNRRPVVPLSTS
ncbi:hypothetical protein [Burkholderia territorii]|uniref:hypothetical protein n=1 Tax=Burkholderia territorii TaxID=1503055 RepID=UPI000AD6F154|nr:hypothetical protein [Burkholderia territorii]